MMGLYIHFFCLNFTTSLSGIYSQIAICSALGYHISLAQSVTGGGIVNMNMKNKDILYIIFVPLLACIS